MKETATLAQIFIFLLNVSCPQVSIAQDSFQSTLVLKPENILTKLGKSFSQALATLINLVDQNCNASVPAAWYAKGGKQKVLGYILGL